jgi:hypothetical protein
MFEPTPRWRWWFVPPQWFRTILAFGPIESIRIWRNPDHPFWTRRRRHECHHARAIYARWWSSLKQSQRSRLLFGLPRPKWRPTARIIWPPEFHPEIARIKREQEMIREWSQLHPDGDPIECPTYQERLARVRERIADF